MLTIFTTVIFIIISILSSIEINKEKIKIANSVFTVDIKKSKDNIKFHKWAVIIALFGLIINFIGYLLK